MLYNNDRELTYYSIKETGRKPPQYPFMFFKAATTVHDHNADVVIPRIAQDDQADYEGELVSLSPPTLGIQRCCASYMALSPRARF